MSADGGPDDLDGPPSERGWEGRRPRRSCRPLWLGGVPEPDAGEPNDARVRDTGGVDPSTGGSADDAFRSSRPDHDWLGHDPATCEECAPDFAPLEDLIEEADPEPDLGEIVVILLVSTLTGLRDRLERDGFGSAAALVHDLVEVADDYVTRFQCEP